MGRPVPAFEPSRFPARKALRRRLGVCAVLCILLAFCVVRLCPARADAGANDGGGSGFGLVAQALQARLRLTYLARQDIFWITPTPAGGNVAQIIVDIARTGRRARIAYRFPAAAAGRVLLDDGVHSSQFDPSRRVLMVGQSGADDRMAASPTTLALLRRNYCCSLMRRELLNDYLCDVVMIRPRMSVGSSKCLWIDAARHAILRSEDYDADGCRRYVSYYETIRFLSHLPADALTLPSAAHAPQTHRMNMPSVDVASARQAFSAARLSGSLPAWCPVGYALVHCAVVGPPAGVRSVVFHYSDGLKSLIVLEEPRAKDDPTVAELNGALARYGQQVWVHEDGRLRTIVRGDLSMPDSLGAEMAHALCVNADAALAQGLARDFGPAAAKQGALLRRAGWGYEQIAALLLGEKVHPALRPRLKPLLDRSVSWAKIAAVFGAGTETLQARSRIWVAATLAAAH